MALKPIGNHSSSFRFGGLNRIALIEYSKVTVTGTIAPNKALTDITAITLADPLVDKFQEMHFLEDSAIMSQQLTKDPANLYYNQTVDFKLDTEDIATVHELVTARKLIALCETNKGTWLLVGLSKGLTATSETTDNYTADDTGDRIVLVAKNRGKASNILMTESEIEALIQS